MPRGSSNLATPVASAALTFRFCDILAWNNNAINSRHLFIVILAGGYRFLDHMTDAVIEAYGTTLEEAFENAAKALCDTMIDLETVRPKKEIKFSAKGNDLYSLLFDWLDKVMLLLVADRIAMSQFSVKIKQHNNSYLLEGITRGEPLELDRHHYKVEIKAVTYHEMEIKQEKDMITARFLLDL
ncbi:MAG TPA: archease [Nitrososphaera sp.]|jgi:SHS2 domain-containing protein